MNNFKIPLKLFNFLIFLIVKFDINNKRKEIRDLSL